MAVLEALTEEECYLVAILQDESGLDLAEFSWIAEENEDACWRAWPFQWSWFRDMSALQIDRGSRSTGKSTSIEVRSFIFPFVHPGEEMVIAAPEKTHLDAITQRIEGRILSTRIGREMLTGTGGRNSFKHQPFTATFANNARIIGRIPQRDGRGFKGIHPIWLELDEAQDLTRKSWVELIETLKRGSTGAVWRAHGVTRGVRDEFYKFTQPDSGWKVHAYVAMCRPNWTDEERQEKIKQYGSKEDPDYRRNVLGEHGDASSVLFPLNALMACVDSDEMSDYNLHEYYHARLTPEMIADAGGSALSLVDYPAAHRDRKGYPFIWIGMDCGYVTDPAEILVFGEMPAAGKKSVLKLLTRVTMRRVTHRDQAKLIIDMIDVYKPKVFAMDSTGLGLPLFQDVQAESLETAKVIRGYNFSSKILVDIDQTVEVDEYTGDVVKDAGIERNVKEYAQDCLRGLVDDKRIWFPWDRELISQFQGGTATNVSGRDQYGRRRIFSGGDDHCLVGETLVATSEGSKRLDEVRVGDLVHTRAGLRPVLDAWLARRDAPLLELTTSDGRTVRGTEDHRFWVEGRGWTYLKDLQPGDTLSCLTENSWMTSTGTNPSLSSTQDGSGGGGQTGIERTPSITTQATSDCTGRSGKTPMVQSPTDSTYITSTRTLSTTISPISPARKVDSTSPITRKSGGLFSRKIPSGLPTWRVFDRWLRNGTGRRKGGDGMSSTGSGLPRLSHSRSAPVKSAVGSSRASRPAGSAVPPASNETTIAIPQSRVTSRASSVDRVSGRSGSLIAGDATTVRSVRALDETADVYDLTVAEVHEFFAGGILVHNCLDAARMAAIGYSVYHIEELTKKQKDEPVFDVFFSL